MRARTQGCHFLILAGFLIFALFSNPLFSFSEETAQPSSDTLNQLDGEVLEVEELRDPEGAAIYTVKDLASGKTVRLFADPYRSLIQMGDEIKSAGDILGGSKATFIYRQAPDQDLAEVIFAKVTSSYHS